MTASARALCRIGILFALAAWTAGCAQLPFGPERERGSPEAFEAQGRVYVRYGARAFSGSLRWQHSAQADEVWLGGPLGQTAAHIVRDSSGAVLTTADQQVYRATSMDALTREGLGWTLPLDDLSFYVLRKVPEAAAAAAERDASGRLLRVEHQGWTVRWTAPQGERAADRTGRIDLGKDDVEIRFVVDRLDRIEP